MTFQVPSDLQPFLELLPKHGVVQGEASLSVQLKFQPLEAMLDREMYERYYTESDDMWRMPVHVGVANQVRVNPMEYTNDHLSPFLCV